MKNVSINSLPRREGDMSGKSLAIDINGSVYNKIDFTYGNLLRMKSCTHNPVDPDPYVARGSKQRLSRMLM